MLSPPLAQLVPPDFAAAVRRALASPPAGVDPWFLSYCSDLAGDIGLRTYVRAKWQLISLIGGVEGRDVLDAGSGFGMVANLLAHWGARRVYAVELRRPLVESHARILARDFPQLGTVHPICGDVSAMPIQDGAVDVVLSIEAVSHYFDVEAFLDECRRVLRHGGMLVISDGNNGANARIRAATEEIWHRWENGPHGVIGEHDIRETFTERRARLIRERGCVAERLFNPVALGRNIERRGFTVRVLPHFGGAKNDLLLAANLALRRLPAFRIARAFRIVATKQ